MPSFIVSIDCLTDYENLFGRSSFSNKGFQLLLDRYEGMDLRLDEIGRLEHYFSEYESLEAAAKNYLDNKIIDEYAKTDDVQILLDAFEENDIDIMYDPDFDICIVDER